MSTTKQDRLFLKARRGGISACEIARRFKVCTKTVYLGIERARSLELPAGTGRSTSPTLVPLFPLVPLSPMLWAGADCPHRGPLRKGSSFVCMVCHQSGLDHLRLFRPHPNDPKREPRRVTAKPAARKTRKEKRSLMDRIKPGRN